MGRRARSARKEGATCRLQKGGAAQERGEGSREGRRGEERIGDGSGERGGEGRREARRGEEKGGEARRGEEGRCQADHTDDHRKVSLQLQGPTQW